MAKAESWIHGSVTYFGEPVEVQERNSGLWYACIRLGGLAEIVTVVGMSTQGAAESLLISRIAKLIKQGVE